MDTENKYVKGLIQVISLQSMKAICQISLSKIPQIQMTFSGLIDGTLEVKLEFQRRQLFILEEIRKKGNDIGLLYDKD